MGHLALQRLLNILRMNSVSSKRIENKRHQCDIRVGSLGETTIPVKPSLSQLMRRFKDARQTQHLRHPYML